MGRIKPEIEAAVREEYANRAPPPGKSKWRKVQRRCVPSQHTLARKYGISQRAVWRIVSSRE